MVFDEEMPDNFNGFNMTIYGENILGTNEVYSNNSTLFPNPATNFIQFKDGNDIQKIDIYNSSGQLILSSFEKKISIAHFSSGTYYIKKYKTDGSLSTSKFIKK